MANTARLGAVIFTGGKNRLAQFYEAVTGLKVSARDDGVTVLASSNWRSMPFPANRVVELPSPGASRT